jgi:hypothetical protein
VNETTEKVNVNKNLASFSLLFECFLTNQNKPRAIGFFRDLSQQFIYLFKAWLLDAAIPAPIFLYSQGDILFPYCFDGIVFRLQVPKNCFALH